VREDFLHYVWQYRAFDFDGLATTAGAPVTVQHPGIYNTDAGPDFMEAQVLIDTAEWHGPVEIHLKASDWYAHHHQEDTAYDKVILHVVWEADRPVTRSDGSEIPTLVLADRVALDLQHNYRNLAESLGAIPCADQLAHVKEVTRLQMLDKALMQRLEKKTRWMQEVYDTHQGDWDVVAYQAMVRAFGFKVNRDPMWEVSRRLPLKLVLKHQSRIDQLEALFFGVAGFLEDKHQTDPYYQILRKEWAFLSHKYQLEPPNPPLPWKMGKIRPANLPPRRLGQLAALLGKEGRLFAMLKEVSSLKELTDRLDVVSSQYWQRHHGFGKLTARPSRGLGKASIQSLVINTVVPLLVAYGKHQNNPQFVEKGVALLQHLPAEDNTVVRRWAQAGLSVNHAFDSQALIGQFEGFCSPRRCLSCPVGISLVRNGGK